MEQSTARRLTSMLLECPLILGYNTSTRFFFVLADNLLFVGTQWLTDGYYNAFDGQRLAVFQATIEMFRTQDSRHPDFEQILLSSPFTNRNFWGDAELSLATKTWAELPQALTTFVFVTGKMITNLFDAGVWLLNSPLLGRRRVALATLAVLRHFSLQPTFIFDQNQPNVPKDRLPSQSLFFPNDPLTSRSPGLYRRPSPTLAVSWWECQY